MYPTKELLLKRCRELRQNSTDAEQLLWSILHNRQVAGMKFRRQHAFKGYILDFYCPYSRLGIEIDGGHHLQQEEYDQERTELLQQFGLRILRFWNDEVLNNLENVVGKIWDCLEEG
jgi:very-short-patch-repair endonuclease